MNKRFVVFKILLKNNLAHKLIAWLNDNIKESFFTDTDTHTHMYMLSIIGYALKYALNYILRYASKYALIFVVNFYESKWLPITVEKE